MLKARTISSPGRICLFGEHQDYLGLPVIPMAINKRLKLHYQLGRELTSVKLRSNQIKQQEELSINQCPILDNSPFDYQKSVFIYFWKKIRNIFPSNLLVDSEIPIRAGLSSSAALLTSMVYLFISLLEEELDKRKIAEIAYHCEHDIMNISCGRMDQYACSLGQIFYMTSENNPLIKPLNLSKNAFFIIGNSQIERKADIPLKQVQKDIFQALKLIKGPNLKELNRKDLDKKNLSHMHKKRLIGVIGVRDNTQKAFKELKKTKPSLNFIGKLLIEQQSYLRENYQVSHPKIDKMCEEAIKNGALGAKLTGAGFGGCMFALAPQMEIATKIRDVLQAYGESFITKIGIGVKENRILE